MVVDLLIIHINSQIDIDFETLYPGKGNLLFTKYEDFKWKIIQRFEEDIKDKASKETLKLNKN